MVVRRLPVNRGYSGIDDHARERLGMAGHTAQARELRTRPRLRKEVRARAPVRSRR